MGIKDFWKKLDIVYKGGFIGTLFLLALVLIIIPQIFSVVDSADGDTTTIIDSIIKFGVLLPLIMAFGSICSPVYQTILPPTGPDTGLLPYSICQSLAFQFFFMILFAVCYLAAFFAAGMLVGFIIKKVRVEKK